MDRFTNRTRDRETEQSREIPRLLAEELKMKFAYGVECQELKQGSARRTAFTGEQTLSIFPLQENQVFPIKAQLADWLSGLLSLFQKRQDGRMFFLYSRVRVAGRIVYLYNAHLESRASDDRKTLQTLEILDHIESNLARDEPVIVAGDLNPRKGGDSPVVDALLARGFLDPFPQPKTGKLVTNRENDRRLDWVFSRNLEPVEAFISGEFLGSNQRALKVVFKFPTEPEAEAATGF